MKIKEVRDGLKVLRRFGRERRNAPATSARLRNSTGSAYFPRLTERHRRVIDIIDAVHGRRYGFLPASSHHPQLELALCFNPLEATSNICCSPMIHPDHSQRRHVET